MLTLEPARADEGSLTAGLRGTAEPVRVLHLVPSLFGGGMERTMVRLIGVLTDGAEGRRDGRRASHGVCVLRDGEEALLAACRDRVPTWILGEAGSGASRTAWWRLRGVIRAFRPQVVHARTTAAWMDAVLATRWMRPDERVRLLLSYHGRTEVAPADRWRRLWETPKRWALRRADAVLAVCDDAATMLVKEWGAAPSRMHVIANGVDISRFHPPADETARAAGRGEFGWNASHRVGICVANLWPIKGIDVLLRAWREVAMVEPAARLLIVGEGPMRAGLEARAAQWRLAGDEPRVVFTGGRDDVAELLRMADLFVLPSRYEGSSNATLEAMATGLPVVVSQVGGMRELIRPQQTGWLVPPDDPHRLAETVVAVLREGAVRRRVGQAARRFVMEACSVEHMAERYARLYEDLARSLDRRVMTGREAAACAG